MSPEYYVGDTLLWGSPYGPATIIHSRIQSLTITNNSRVQRPCPTCSDHEIKTKYVVEKTRYEFDEQGYPVSIKYSGRHIRGFRMYRIVNVYDSLKRLISSDLFFITGENQEKKRNTARYKYNAAGKPCEIDWNVDDSLFTSNLFLTYDEHNRLIRSEFYKKEVSAREFPLVSVELKYDSINRLLSRSETNLTQVEPLDQRNVHWVYQYDQHGQKTTEVVYVNDQLHMKYLVTFDPKSNTRSLSDTLNKTTLGRRLKGFRLEVMNDDHVAVSANITYNDKVVNFRRTDFLKNTTLIAHQIDCSDIRKNLPLAKRCLKGKPPKHSITRQAFHQAYFTRMKYTYRKN
jgi:hypothetical protein